MDYKEYYKSYYNYRKAKNDIIRIEDSIADIINALLSISTTYKETNSSSNTCSDKVSKLTVEKVYLEGQAKLAKELLAIRENQKNEDEIELRKSKDNKDIIYFKYYIDHLKVREIAKQIPLAREYTHALLKEIRKEIAKLDEELRKKKNKKK